MLHDIKPLEKRLISCSIKSKLKKGGHRCIILNQLHTSKTWYFFQNFNGIYYAIGEIQSDSRTVRHPAESRSQTSSNLPSQHHDRTPIDEDLLRISVGCTISTSTTVLWITTIMKISQEKTRLPAGAAQLLPQVLFETSVFMSYVTNPVNKYTLSIPMNQSVIRN